MAGILENMLLLGLGTVALGKNAAETALREALKKNNLSDSDCNSILKSVTEEGQKTKDLLEQAIEEVIKTRGQSLLPCNKRFQELEARVAELEKKLAVTAADASK